jgi:hypothetical protein
MAVLGNQHENSPHFPHLCLSCLVNSESYCHLLSALRFPQLSPDFVPVISPCSPPAHRSEKALKKSALLMSVALISSLCADLRRLGAAILNKTVLPLK